MTKGLVTKKRIGVLMGGLSAERDVSMRSGLAIYQDLLGLGYDAVLIDVGKDIATVLKKEKVKVAFLALHGGTGENGAIQGLLEVLGIPFTGSGILASALAMDKEASKKMFLYHGLDTAPYMIVKKAKSSRKRGDAGKQAAEKADIMGAYLFPNVPKPEFGPPWVVKPVAEGSSLGVSIIQGEDDFVPGIEKTLAFGNTIMIEKFIKGKEIHIGILGDRVLGGVEVRPSLEFYNYEAKYTSGLTDYIIPPEIERPVYEKVKEMALMAHHAIGCSGAGRVDFMIDESSRPFILEVNTLPGMTTTSLLPKIAKSAGMEFKDLIEEIIKLAI